MKNMIRWLIIIFKSYCFQKSVYNLKNVHIVRLPNQRATVLPAKSDSDVMFCLQF